MARGGWVTIFLVALIVYFQLQDKSYRTAVFMPMAYLIIGLIYFTLNGRHPLILSPEEEFAIGYETKAKIKKSVLKNTIS